MKRHLKDQTATAVRFPLTSPPIRPSYEAVSRRAREIWQNRGHPRGCDDDIWFQAEREVRPSYAAVSRRAREIWQGRGHPQGCDDDIWFQAEREVAEEMRDGMPPLEDRGLTPSVEEQDLVARTDETIAHHPRPGLSATAMP